MIFIYLFHSIGCAGLLVGHPFDTVKVHMQTQDVKNPKFRGTFHCLKSIAAKESIRGLYRGLSSPMAGVSVINGIVFGVYGNVQRLSSNPDSMKSHFIAGSAAGLIQSLICSPMELAKTQLQLQNDRFGVTKFKGPTQCLSYIYRCDGIRGVFKGLNATALRDVPGFATYFVSYEYFMRLKQNPGILYTLFAGGMAGMCSWVLTIPIDVIKSRIQVDGMTDGRPSYNGMIDCFRKSYKMEGSAFFTRGLTSTLLRAFPMNAVCFLVVSMTIKSWHELPANHGYYTVEQLQRTHDHFNHWEHKRKILQGFLYIGAFSEAICSSEIMEVANDWYDNNKIRFSNNRFNFSPNNEHYLQLCLQPNIDQNMTVLNDV